jgi:hypothetical protein
VSGGHVTTQRIGGHAPANGYYVVFNLKATATASVFTLDPTAFQAMVNDGHYDVYSGNAPSLSLPNNVNAATGGFAASVLTKGQSASREIAFDIPDQHGTIEFTPGNATSPVVYWSF